MLSTLIKVIIILFIYRKLIFTDIVFTPWFSNRTFFVLLAVLTEAGKTHEFVIQQFQILIFGNIASNYYYII